MTSDNHGVAPWCETDSRNCFASSLNGGREDDYQIFLGADAVGRQSTTRRAPNRAGFYDLELWLVPAALTDMGNGRQTLCTIAARCDQQRSHRSRSVSLGSRCMFERNLSQPHVRAEACSDVSTALCIQARVVVGAKRNQFLKPTLVLLPGVGATRGR